MSEEIKVDGTADRKNSGKLDLNYCPVSMQIAVATVFAYNSKKNGGKYDDLNWMKGQKYSIPLASIKRHLEEFINGQDIDKDSGLPNLWMIATNVAMLIEYSSIYPNGDDRAIKNNIKQSNFHDLINVYNNAIALRGIK